MINILNTYKMKPNFSELARIYDLDRHTIKKYYDNGGKKLISRKRDSGFEKYKDEIISIMNKPGVTKKAAYEFLKDKYKDIPSYSTFRYYTRINHIVKFKSSIPHVRFETKPGEQLQVDWKENIRLISKNGEIFDFNVLTSTLGYSRLHTFIYSKTKTTEDFIRCVIDTLNIIGGTPKQILADNMSAIVSINNGTKHKHTKIKQFEKDLGLNIKLCGVRSPETKGKDESANRFLAWLQPYDGEFENETELIEILKKINNKVNLENNQTTNIPPSVLFQKEKEYLNPLPNKLLLDSYVENVDIQTVPPTLLVTYKGNGYSVPPKFINKRVKIIPIDNKLYIYFTTELIIIHDISNKKFNYNENHYKEGLSIRTNKSTTDIEETAKENLALLDTIKGDRNDK